MIEAKNLTKRYGDRVAVDDLSFTVTPGRVTGFLGANGAGKSTTIRLLLGLDHPDAGTATIGGVPYRTLSGSLHLVGALLESRAVHTGRTAFNHLLCLAQTQGIGRDRVREVLDIVGLRDVANRRTGGFSLGMSQRLGVAAALLGNPQVLILDEPVNGLDPEGIIWIRNLLKELAADGRTVFVSSHLMSEVAMTAEHLVVIGRGRLVADCPTEAFIERGRRTTVLVRTPHADRLADLIAREGAVVTHTGGTELTVAEMEAARIGEIAAGSGLVLHEVVPQRGSLEEAFIELTRDSVEYDGTPHQSTRGAA